MISEEQTTAFQETVWEYFRVNGRSMPWRDDPTPYRVLVSEIMLQQTQVPRVIPKFNQFMARFPTIQTLAKAPLSDVLAVWSGLGYNRRAKFLWQAAQEIVREHNGNMPRTLADLVALPGVGANTAGAICAYAFGRPAIFVETNIRTVIIYHFFADAEGAVTDAQIRSVLERTLPKENLREWYWALMDYGTHLKATVGAQLQRVHGHRTQSAFQGSRRQVRGIILKLLLGGAKTTAYIQQKTTDSRVPEVLDALHKEGLIQYEAGIWHLTGHER